MVAVVVACGFRGLGLIPILSTGLCELGEFKEFLWKRACIFRDGALVDWVSHGEKGWWGKVFTIFLERVEVYPHGSRLVGYDGTNGG